MITNLDFWQLYDNGEINPKIYQYKRDIPEGSREAKEIEITAFEYNNKYYLRIVPTYNDYSLERGRKTYRMSGKTSAYIKEFDNKYQANNYFKKVVSGMEKCNESISNIAENSNKCKKEIAKKHISENNASRNPAKLHEITPKNKNKIIGENKPRGDKMKKKLMEKIRGIMGKGNENMHSVETHAVVPPTYQQAIEQEEENAKHTEKMWDDKMKEADGIILGAPGTGKKISRKPYTEKLTLDEGLFEEARGLKSGTKRLSEKFDRTAFVSITPDEREQIEMVAEELGIDATDFEKFVVNYLTKLADKRDEEASDIRDAASMSYEDWKKLRGEISVGSLYTRDYENTFGLDRHLVSALADGYVEYLWELAQEQADEGERENTNKFPEDLDTPDEFANYCYGVEFEDGEGKDEGALKEIEDEINGIREDLFGAEELYDLGGEYQYRLTKRLIGEGKGRRGNQYGSIRRKSESFGRRMLKEMTDTEIKAAKRRLPKITRGEPMTPEQLKERQELSCRDMINSILTYDWMGETAEEVVQLQETNKYNYLREYIKALGRERVVELVQEQIDDIDGFDRDVYTDPEGNQYSSIRWKRESRNNKPAPRKKLKEEYGEYEGEYFCDEIGDRIEDDYWSGDVDGVEWELDVNGYHSSDFRCPWFRQEVSHNISYPVKDGHLSYMGLDFVMNTDSPYLKGFNEDYLRHDLELFDFDEDKIEKIISSAKNGEDYEFEFWADYDTNFDVDAWEEAQEDEDEEEDEDLNEAKLTEERSPRVRTMSVSDGKRVRIDQYPSFSATGSITGMRKQYYGDKAYLVRCGSYIYNVPEDVYYQAH